MLVKKSNSTVLWHLHDLWPLQDIFHTPNTYHTKSGIRRSWSLEGRPNVFQYLVMKRSRTQKKRISKQCVYVTSTSELREWLLHTPPYTYNFSEANSIVIPQPLTSLKTYLQTMDPNIKVESNKCIVIGGNHFVI